MSKQISLILALLMCLPIGYFAVRKLKVRTPGFLSGCPDWVLTETENSANFVHPDKVVVEPWQGRHNVFATFKVPDGYQPIPFVVVTFKDSNPYCGNVVMRPTGNGNHQVFGLFRTRTTLLLMSRGKLDQLEQPSNWKLAIFKH